MKPKTINSAGNLWYDETLEELITAGFTEYEAKVYLSLLSRHPASAYTISRNSGVPHSRVYDVSRRLITKGFAASSGTNPELFSPLSPKELVDKIKRDNDELTRKLKKRLSNFRFVSDFDPVWNIKNGEEAIEKVREIVAEAQRKIYIGIWLEDFLPIKEELRRAHDRGVKLFMLVYGETDIDFGEYYFHAREHLESIDTIGRTIDCTADSAVCITGDLGGPGPTRVVWTRNFGLVFSIENYLIHDLFIHEMQKTFGRKMDYHYGENLRLLRKRFHHIELEFLNR